MQNQRCKTLIVDDDESVLAVLENLLLTAGIDVVVASSAEQALEVFTEHDFDVVLTDVQMGRMSGFDLLKRIKLIDASMHVIVMTSYNSFESVLQAMQLGAYDYIQKPIISDATVSVAVQRAYDNSKLQKENMELLVQLKDNHEQLTQANKNLKLANRKLTQLAITDGLTNLYNRRYFDQLLKREVGRRNRYRQALTVVMADIDNFKMFNDQHGHSGGDLAIKTVARVLHHSARTTDFIARYGGEEFVLLLPLTNPIDGVTFAERLLRNVEQQKIQISSSLSVSVTLSIGIAGVSSTDGPIPAPDLLRHSDQALYKAKQGGKNQCRLIEIGDSTSNAA